MNLFYVLLILLVVTRKFGELAVRLGQPSLVGELLCGTPAGRRDGHRGVCLCR